MTKCKERDPIQDSLVPLRLGTIDLAFQYQREVPANLVLVTIESTARISALTSGVSSLAVYHGKSQYMLL